MPDKEDILLKAIAEGDEDSFKRVFVHYYPKVIYFQGWGGNPTVRLTAVTPNEISEIF